VYSPQKLDEKLSMLKSLSNLQHRYPLKRTIYGGDFNMITSLTEKKGGIRMLNRDVEAFNNFIKTMKLVDVIPKSGAYT